TKAQPFVKTDLDSIANDVIDDLEVRLQQTGGRVDVLELPTIEADPLQMRQLLQNLIGNALKFHRGGVAPIIKVSGHLNTEGKKNRRSNGLCEIRVEDNGIGFDEKYLDRIFTPFQRLHGRGEYEGTGIGLAVCRKIVERHGGTLTATSRSGEGSTFIVTLPTKHDEEK
ncbi:MAG TPA: ATP-binding protein, partial [Pyrinomonadaceae bacterium]|nr:ATP-binding protein [Pyrinomonadaceae bacterium]